MSSPKGVTDYSAMSLGTVTRTFKGQKVCWIASCPKCSRRGERHVVIPKADGFRLGAKGYLSFHHRAHLMSFGGIRALSVDESCTVSFSSATADDLLTVAELREYAAFVAAVRAKVDEL